MGSPVARFEPCLFLVNRIAFFRVWGLWWGICGDGLGRRDVLVNRREFFRGWGLWWGSLAARRPGVRGAFGGLGGLIGCVLGHCFDHGRCLVRQGHRAVGLETRPGMRRTEPSAFYPTGRGGFETRIGHPPKSMVPVKSRFPRIRRIASPPYCKAVIFRRPASRGAPWVVEPPLPPIRRRRF